MTTIILSMLAGAALITAIEIVACEIMCRRYFDRDND